MGKSPDTEVRCASPKVGVASKRARTSQAERFMGEPPNSGGAEAAFASAAARSAREKVKLSRPRLGVKRDSERRISYSGGWKQVPARGTSNRSRMGIPERELAGIAQPLESPLVRSGVALLVWNSHDECGLRASRSSSRDHCGRIAGTACASGHDGGRGAGAYPIGATESGT